MMENDHTVERVANICKKCPNFRSSVFVEEGFCTLNLVSSVLLDYVPEKCRYKLEQIVFNQKLKEATDELL